jgi:hypothetical protein
MLFSKLLTLFFSLINVKNKFYPLPGNAFIFNPDIENVRNNYNKNSIQLLQFQSFAPREKCSNEHFGLKTSI